MLVTDVGRGVYRFAFFGDHVQPNGNLDFTPSSLAGKPVKIEFSATATQRRESVSPPPPKPPSGSSKSRKPARAARRAIRAVSSRNSLTSAPAAGAFRSSIELSARADAPVHDRRASLAFLEAQKDGVFEYALLLRNPDGAMMVMDPEIKNGGSGGGN